MLALGIDPGTETTGYGIVSEDDAGALSAVCFGVIKTSKNTPPELRLKQIYEELTSIIFLNSPVCAAVEKLFFQKNVTNAIAVGQARGVVLLALAQAQMPVSEYTPNEVKQSVTGYGGADKKQVQEMVRLLLSLEDVPRPDDAADALAVAICHLRHQHLLTLAQGEA